MKKEYNRYYVLWIVTFGIGVLLRVLYLTQFPMGTNADEAYAGYEAYAMLQSGMDSHGYHNPVYFVSWGSGMNILYSYITMLFIKIGGASLLMIRLPQAIFGCASLVVFYLLLKEVKGQKFALLGMLILAINPWHIMMSRWGLESNIAPAMILFGIYFIIKAYQGKKIYYIFAGIFLGLALYAYAVMWAFVPLLVFFTGVYGIYHKRVTLNRYSVTGVCILFIFALPLLLFVAVNKGWLPEIVTEYISIPQMDSMRDGELSFHGILGKVKDLLYFLATQVDRDSFNTSNVGIYHFCSIPLLIVGMISGAITWIKKMIRKEYDGESIIGIWFVTAFMVGCVISYVNVNKLNCIHMPMIYFSVRGIHVVIEKTKKWLIYPIVFIYIISTIIFGKWYFNEAKVDFYYGYEEALSYAEDVTDGTIGVVMVRYSNVLFYSQLLPEEYLEEVSFTKNYDTVNCFGRYYMNSKADQLQEDMVYVIAKPYVSDYLQEGWTIQYDNDYYVVISYQY